MILVVFFFLTFSLYRQWRKEPLKRHDGVLHFLFEKEKMEEVGRRKKTSISPNLSDKFSYPFTTTSSPYSIATTTPLSNPFLHQNHPPSPNPHHPKPLPSTISTIHLTSSTILSAQRSPLMIPILPPNCSMSSKR